jgi:hypothetical protein
MTTTKFWAIKYVKKWGSGFYTGTYLKRVDAIEDHVKQIGVPWKKMYKSGDRVVRVIVTDEHGVAP